MSPYPVGPSSNDPRTNPASSWYRFLTARRPQQASLHENDQLSTQTSDMRSYLLQSVAPGNSYTAVESFSRSIRFDSTKSVDGYIPNEAVFANDIAEKSQDETRSRSPMDCSTTSGSPTSNVEQMDILPCFIQTTPQSPAKHNPLNIPEILEHIFSFLETNLNTGTDPDQPLDFVKVDSIKYTITKPRLHSAVLVNKLWNACGTKFMWRNIKIGQEINSQRLASTLSHSNKRYTDDAVRAMGKAPFSICHGSNKRSCRYHMNAITIPSSVNGWIYGDLIRSVTLVPPHSASGASFEAWNVDFVVTMLAVTCPRLEDLNVSNCTGITDNPLVLLAQHCKHLKKLNVNRCDLVTDATLWALARNTTMLEVLNLSRPLLTQRTHLSDAAIQAVIENNPKLKELRIRNCDRTSDSTVLAVGRSCGQNLRALDLSWCSQITDVCVTQGIGPNCTRLISLALNGCKLLTDASLHSILSACPSLASLSLSHLPAIQDTVLSQMAERLKNLVILSLNGCNGIRDPSLISLARNCPNLQSLSLFSLDITDSAVREIASNCPRLVSLSVSGCRRITDIGAVHIAKLEQLGSLYLNQSQVTDKVVVHLASSCRKLRALSLNECNDLTDRSAVGLSRFCNSLQSVSMNQCSITAVGVKSIIDGCPDLRELSIKGCNQCFLRGPRSQEFNVGNGGMQMLSAIGAEVYERMMKRRVALLID